MNTSTPEQQRQWMAQWRHAAVELELQRGRELIEMTDAEALRLSDILLSMPVERPERDNSGLVEQQRWFQKLRRA